MDAAERESAEKRACIKVGDVCLQRRVSLERRRRHRGKDGVHKRHEVRRVGLGAVRRLRRRRYAGPCRCVDHGELDLRLAGVEVEEQLVHVVEHGADTGVRAVGLVDAHHDRQVRLEGLAQHEPGLRQRALAGIDEQHDAVHHRKPALHLATEVGVAGRVDDVDRHGGVRGSPALPPHRGVLGQDRDALLTLEVAGVEHTVGHILVRPKRAGLPEHRVDKRCLPMVDVGDDGDVAQVGTAGHATQCPAGLQLR